MQQDWIALLKPKAQTFLTDMRGKKRSGFFRYSYSGDYVGESIKWGLGNAVFFLKSVYTLQLQDDLAGDVLDAMNFIKSFRRKDGMFADPLVHALAAPRSFLLSLKKRDKKHFGLYTKLAETRQSVSALNLFGSYACPYPDILPQNQDEVSTYLSALDWEKPWHAGSHLSILLFFIRFSDRPDKSDMEKAVVAFLRSIEQPDGCWYTGSPTLQQKINGAMKIITGANVIQADVFHEPKQLIDMCLTARNDAQACDNFNIVYVLKYANMSVDGAYRHDEIVSFMKNRLAIYKAYYFPDLGGFSFHKGRANTRYYHARLSRGKNEPDIHGTVLFLWGMSVIGQVIPFENELSLREFLA